MIKNIFNMGDPNAKKEINKLRQEIFAEKQYQTDILEKRIIATAKIKIEPRKELPIIWTTDDFEMDTYYDYCKLMELFIEKELHADLSRSARRQEIEKSIKEAFIDYLEAPDSDYPRIKKLNIRLIDSEVGDVIEPDPEWLKEQDLTTETE